EDIINIRERKIVLAALRTVRGELPPTNLTEDERKFFDKLVETLKSFKNEMKEKFRKYEEIVEEKVGEAKKSIEELKPVENKEEQEKNKFIKPNGKLLVKILSDLPRFIGNDMKSYGPLKAGDVVFLPEEVGKILINRNAAENILE
ncbi:MAG: hypothetical protein QXD43_04910, partial [Candidatus Aenigmatarchaeota archaeon]